MKRWSVLLAVSLALVGSCETASADQRAGSGGSGSPSHTAASTANSSGGGQRDHRGEGGRWGSHHHFRGGFFLAIVPLFWTSPFCGDRYCGATAVKPRPTVYYVEKADPDQIRNQPGRWYFCPGQGYYPTVQECPDGWMRVFPTGPGWD